MGGALGSISWRGPFYGVAVLMCIAAIATWILLPKTPLPKHRQGILEPIKALRHRSLAATSGVGILYNWGFFTILGFSPFLMGIDSPQQLGVIFFAWGILVAIFAIFGAPALRNRFGTARTLYGNMLCLAVVIAVVAIWAQNTTVVITAVILSGIFAGINNTLVTTAVMGISPVERSVASATYGFVRFLGGGLAPLAAGLMVTAWGNPHIPFAVAAVAVAGTVPLVASVHKQLEDADRGAIHQPELDPVDDVERKYDVETGAGIGSEI